MCWIGVGGRKQPQRERAGRGGGGGGILATHTYTVEAVQVVCFSVVVFSRGEGGGVLQML